MLVKIITLFLIAMVALAMFGRWRLPRIGNPHDKLARGTCAACGRPRIGKGRCPCGKDKA